MSRAKKLLEQATPLPWRLDRWLHDSKGYGAFHAKHRPFDGHGMRHADLDLAEYAVNRLPDYEAAVDALRRLTTAVSGLSRPGGCFCDQSPHAPECGEMLHALARAATCLNGILRDEVPA